MGFTVEQLFLMTEDIRSKLTSEIQENLLIHDDLYRQWIILDELSQNRDLDENEGALLKALDKRLRRSKDTINKQLART